MIWWLGPAVGLLVGIIFGWVICRVRLGKKSAGTLRMDSSDPSEAPYLFLELERGGMDAIYRNKIVIFKVDLKGYMSRK